MTELSAEVEFPEDVKILRERIHILNLVSDYGIDCMYSDFSQTRYCAGWMILNDGLIEEFDKWIKEKWIK